jgi:predicted ATPase
MKIKSFEIKNFKGIANCRISIEDDAPGRIVTLIGLNESGKTTVLEALANFIGQDEDLSSLIGTKRPKGYVREFVPKHRKANFTGSIELIATLEVESSDLAYLADGMSKQHDVVLDTASMPKEFEVARTHEFKNSEPIESSTNWDIEFSAKKRRQKNFKLADNANDDVWQACIKLLGERLPKISYFPTFLFEVPERIYLEETENEGTSGYYRQILQDVLDAQGEGLSLKEHVVDRIERERQAAQNPFAFFANFFGRDAKKQIDAVFRAMSSELSRKIFGAWNEIFENRPKDKHISIEWGVDADKENAVFAQLFIVDGNSQYALTERSLGFRWFFCFLLFTRFRASRQSGRKTYFLFDEPASNLHAKAQLQLLASFPTIAGNENVIIYSTHSHYMIEPLWLERAYVVINKAVDYEISSESMDYFSTRPTEIVADKYRNFVSQHPDRTTYFQPVLDQLDYVVSPIIGNKNCLIMEGKHDFYAMKYLLPPLGCSSIDILPGTGAGNLEAIISMYLGWGRKFIVLLDDDKAGRDQKDRYFEEYLLSKEQVMTLGDIDASLAGKKLEGLFSEMLAQKVGTAGRPRKKDFALFFQERLATNFNLGLEDIDADTKSRVQLVSDFVRQRLG